MRSIFTINISVNNLFKMFCIKIMVEKCDMKYLFDQAIGPVELKLLLLICISHDDSEHLISIDKHGSMNNPILWKKILNGGQINCLKYMINKGFVFGNRANNISYVRRCANLYENMFEYDYMTESSYLEIRKKSYNYIQCENLLKKI